MSPSGRSRQRENQPLLHDQLDRQRGTQAAAEASIIDYNILLALNNLPSLTGIPTAKAQVVGGATNNIDQIVEINKGANEGIAVGMPVVNQAGLIGKITQVNATTSKVMLVTDPRYSIAVEILGGTGEDSSLDDLATSNTTPSGRTDDENAQIVRDEVDAATSDATDGAEGTADGGAGDTGDETGDGDTDGADEGDEADEVPSSGPATTNPEDVFADDIELPQAGDDLPDPGVVTPGDSQDSVPPGAPGDESDDTEDDDTGDDDIADDDTGDGDTGDDDSGDGTEGDDAQDAQDDEQGAPPSTDPDGEPVRVTTTTVVEPEPVQLEKEFGVLEGRGEGQPTQIRFLQDIPALAILEVGDLVETAGPSDSPAPPNIPVGRVIHRADRPGVAGPLLQIELNADLDKLNFVRVVLFRPLSEAEE